MLRGGPLSRLPAALFLLLGLAACDLPGAHAGEAAVVNGHAVARARWDRLVDLTSQQLKSRVPVDLNSDAGRPQLRNIQTKALQAVIREDLVEQFARQRKVVVTDGDVDREVARLAEALGGSSKLKDRLDRDGETMTDLRQSLRINLLRTRMKAGSPTYQADYEKAVKDAEVTAYVPPCESEHAWPQCAGGQR